MPSKTCLPPVPAALADVALIDAPACAAAGAMSVSWWHEEVRAGRAPQPVIKKPRCTRWRVVDVRAFWGAEQIDAQAGARVAAQAVKASAAAQAKRRAQSAQVRA